MYQPPQQAKFFGRVDRLAHAVRIDRQIDLLRQAVEALTRDGHVVLSAGIGEVKPFAILAPSILLSQLVDQGKGAYFMRGFDGHGHYRKGQLIEYRAVNVTWTERGH